MNIPWEWPMLPTDDNVSYGARVSRRHVLKTDGHYVSPSVSHADSAVEGCDQNYLLCC